MNIQEIITLIRSGSSNSDHHEGQQQIEEAVELLKKMQAVGQWQPMETAPKDGREIIAYDSDLSVLTVYYIDNKWTNPCDRDEYYDAVTHWMPWPEPPAST